MATENHYFLGVITKNHGLKGNLVLYLDTDEPDFYKNLKRIYIKKEGLLTPFFVENSNLLPNGTLLIKLEGIDMEASSSLIKKEVYLPLEELPPLEGNKFYYHEIIGFLVVDTEGNEIGFIQFINDQTPQPLFEIKNNQNQEILIPIVEEWIIEVNKIEKKIILNLPTGLVDVFTKSI